MKWLTLVLYSALIIMIGVGLFNKSDSDSKMNYIKDNAQDQYDEGNINNYLEAYFVATGRDQYINEGVYYAKSNDDTYGFEFSIFHSKIIKKKEEANVLVLALHNLNIDYDPVNKINYEENKDLVKIKITVKLLNFENSVRYSLDGKITPSSTSATMDIFLPLEFLITENDNGQMMFNFDNKLTSSIEKITFEIEDYTNASDEPSLTKFAEINNSAYEEKTGVIDNLEKSATGILQSTKFNGQANRFSLEEIYNNENNSVVTEIDLSLIKPYNKTIYKTMGIYALIVITLTTLIFGFKPIVSQLKTNTKKSIVTETVTINEQIDDLDENIK